MLEKLNLAIPEFFILSRREVPNGDKLIFTARVTALVLNFFSPSLSPTEENYISHNSFDQLLLVAGRKG